MIYYVQGPPPPTQNRNCCVPACFNGNPNSPGNPDRCSCCYDSDENLPNVNLPNTEVVLFSLVFLIVSFMWLKQFINTTKKRIKQYVMYISNYIWDNTEELQTVKKDDLRDYSVALCRNVIKKFFKIKI